METWEFAILGATCVLGLTTLAFYFLTGVPPVSARRDEIRDVIALLQEAELSSLEGGGVIYELGCGVGSLGTAIARAFPSSEVIGIELSPVVFFLAWIRSLGTANFRVRWGNFLRSPLSNADAVTAYLMIGPMPPLAEHLDEVLPKGTPVVTLTFWFRDRKPQAVKKGPGLRGDAALYRWAGRSQVTEGGMDSPP